jgi:hypothetical protein
LNLLLKVASLAEVNDRGAYYYNNYQSDYANTHLVPFREWMIWANLASIAG